MRITTAILDLTKNRSLVTVPKGAEILGIQSTLDGVIAYLVLRDSGIDLREEYRFAVCRDGEPCPDATAGRYLASIRGLMGFLHVFHIDKDTQ